MTDQQDMAERLETITVCLYAVSDLLVPQNDLTCVKRENLSQLVGFLMDEYRLAFNQVTIT